MSQDDLMDKEIKLIQEVYAVKPNSLYLGPFEWDSDVIAIGPGNRFYRRSTLERDMKRNHRNERV